MKISKVKEGLKLEPETGNDCFTCGVIVAKRGVVKVELADFGLEAITVPDESLLLALCGDRDYLPKGRVAESSEEIPEFKLAVPQMIKCPDCGGKKFDVGSSGGGSLNVRCMGCGQWWNNTVFGMERSVGPKGGGKRKARR